MKDDNNPYLNEGSKYLVKSFCVFVDILGYSSEILEFSKSGKQLEHFEKFYTTFLKATESIRDSEQLTIQTKIFSDNILIGAPIANRGMFDDETQLGTLAMFLKYLQLDLTLEGYFLRGGWTIGNLFIDENIAYGDGLISSYKLEQSTNFPRIEVSSEIEPLIRKHFEYYADPTPTLQNTYLIKNNDRICINYLKGLTEYGDYGLEVDTKNLGKHKELVESRLIDFNSIPRIRSKYEWSAEYHNYFVDEFLGEKYIEYKIDNIKLNSFWKILDK
jgi:hypothetical protein